MNTPKLRFKDFSDELREFKLEDISEVSRGKFTPRPRNDPRYFLNGTTPFLQTGDIVKAPLYIEKYSQFLNEEGVKVSKIFNADTVFVTIAANIGDVAIAKETVACTDSVVAIVPREDIVDFLWLKYFLDTKKNELNSKATQNAQKNINLQVLKPLKLCLPKLEEQKRISSFLAAVDKKISLLSQKHELLTTYKNGVVQRIFNQEIRFKNDVGGDFPKWDITTIAESCECLDYKRKPLNDSERQLMKGEIPYWGANNIMSYVNDFIFDETIVLLAEDGGNFNEYKTKPIANLSHGKCWVNNHTHVLKGKPFLLNEFLFHSLAHKNITAHIPGGTRPKLTKGSMLKIQFDLPCFGEQKKIVTFLTALSDKILNTQKRLDLTKHYKQGLLQQMFI